MARDPAELLKDALELPTAARAALADSLWESLDGEVDEHLEDSWAQEIERRLRAIDSGDVTLIPWDEAQRRLRSVSQR